MTRHTAENRRHQASYKHIPREDYLIHAREFALRGPECAKKLTTAKVAEIRLNRDELSVIKLAEKYGVGRTTIYNVITYETWI